MDTAIRQAAIDERQAASERLTFTVEETGRILGIGRGPAYAGVRRGEIPSLRFGRRIVVPRAALERLLASGQAGGDCAEGVA